jgi:hypothetical protein
MMRNLHFTLGKLFAAVLLILCLGVQVLEATGRWDGTLQDTTDEAVVVAVVLCVGAGIAAARAVRQHLSVSAIRSVIVVVRTARRPPTSFSLPLAFCVSPPLSLRI